MKRKLALLLAGCLAISPAAAGYYPAQALAAETDAGSESGDPVPAKISVSVRRISRSFCLEQRNSRDH